MSWKERTRSSKMVLVVNPPEYNKEYLMTTISDAGHTVSCCQEDKVRKGNSAAHTSNDQYFTGSFEHREPDVVFLAKANLSSLDPNCKIAYADLDFGLRNIIRATNKSGVQLIILDEYLKMDSPKPLREILKTADLSTQDRKNYEVLHRENPDTIMISKINQIVPTLNTLQYTQGLKYFLS